MRKFLSRPVVKEAVQFTGENQDEIQAFCPDIEKDPGGGMMVRTLEGAMYISPGDWVIKSVRGEFYPCKPDVFERTYDPLDKAEETAFIEAAISILIKECHETAVSKGWWDEPRSDGECIALMHSELSEALEYARKKFVGGPHAPSDHLPGTTGIAEEMADVLIRVFDYCGDRGIPLGRALLDKMAFNTTRPHKHGKKF